MFLLHPLFVVGFIIRLMLIVFVMPNLITDWFAPFLESTINNPTWDPWGTWLVQQGDPMAFPYGYAMWIFLLPFSWVANLLSVPLEYGYIFTLLVVDITLLFVLKHLLPQREKLILVVYWLSPIIILATYGLGMNDLIPTLLLVLSLIAIRQSSLQWAGAFIAAAISAKLSMIVAFPFIVIYFYHNKGLRQRSKQFIAAFVMVSIILFFPFLLSDGGLTMVVNNPEVAKVYQLGFSLNKSVMVYVIPLIYLMMLYMTWRVKRPNFDLFQATIGVAFLIIVLLTPASPGWFIWALPFLVIYQSMSGRIAISLVFLFSGLYVVSVILVSPVHVIDGIAFSFHDIPQIDRLINQHTISLFHTGMVAIGAVLILRIWRESVSQNDFFRLNRKPFTLGIAGDSGSGKDTFSDSITDLYGSHSVVMLSGDDYHLWDRQKPMWQVMTHLNPMANDLEGFSHDLIALTDGKTIQSRRYDHSTGKISKPYKIKSNHFIIVSGLHSLYLPILRECYDLKIYLDMDEGLRRYFKTKRDIEERGSTLEEVRKQFDKRASDATKFIKPQANHADLIMTVMPIHPRMIEQLNEQQQLRLKLKVKTRHGFNELSLNRILVGVCGLHVDLDTSDDGSEVIMTIEGEATSEDIALAAQMLCPRVFEYLDVCPRWRDGMQGLMQLVTLSHLNQVMLKRFI